jgi:multidrug efflux pump
MLTGTLVTAAGFLPVGFAQSTAGEYAGNIFWVVGLALVVSWLVAVIFTPYLGVKLLPNVHSDGAHGGHAADAIYDTWVYRGLRRVVTWALRRRWMVIGATVASFIAAGVGMSFVQQQFFATGAVHRSPNARGHLN